MSKGCQRRGGSGAQRTPSHLGPRALLYTIREAQSVLVAIVSPELRLTPRGENLERFLTKLLDPRGGCSSG